MLFRSFNSCGSRALERRLSSCGTRAYLLRGMWDLRGPGLELMSPALAGGFLTTAPPGKPNNEYFLSINMLPPPNCTGHIYTKKVFVVYLKSKLKWCPAFLCVKSGNLISVLLRECASVEIFKNKQVHSHPDLRYSLLKTHCT